MRVSFWKAGVEAAYVVFDAHGTDKTSWFDCDKILYSSWNDLSSDNTPYDYCAVAGYNGYIVSFLLKFYKTLYWSLRLYISNLKYF